MQPLCSTGGACEGGCLCPPETHTCEAGVCQVRGRTASGALQLAVVHSLSPLALLARLACTHHRPSHHPAPDPDPRTVRPQSTFEKPTAFIVGHRNLSAEVAAADEDEVGGTRLLPALCVHSPAGLPHSARDCPTVLSQRAWCSQLLWVFSKWVAKN